MFRALKDAAKRRGTSVSRIVEEALDAYGITIGATSLVARARERAGMDETAASDLAVRETRAARRG
jgi:hypothetical protein